MMFSFRGRRVNAPTKSLPQKTEASQDVMRLIFDIVKDQNERLALMSASLDALKADVTSLGTEVAQAIALIQANAANTATAAADEAEITALEATVTSLRDQLAAALAPAPVVTPPAA